jgi:hypothetical protein
MGVGGKAIPPYIDKIENIRSDAEFILLVEKEAAYMRMAVRIVQYSIVQYSPTYIGTTGCYVLCNWLYLFLNFLCKVTYSDRHCLFSQ